MQPKRPCRSVGYAVPMTDAIGSWLVELLIVGVLSLVSLALVAAGLAVEAVAAAEVTSGDPMVGAWEAAFGLLLLYAGAYAVGYREVWPRIAALVQR